MKKSTIHRITIAGGAYEDYYEHHHHFSTQEKAMEYAKSYVNKVREWWAEKNESVSYREIELDTNLMTIPQYFIYDGNKYAPTDRPADKVTIVTNEEYWRQ